MFNRIKRTRRYDSPWCKVTPMAFESNFCATVRFQIEVKDLENINAGDEEATAGEYFEDIIS